MGRFDDYERPAEGYLGASPPPIQRGRLAAAAVVLIAPAMTVQGVGGEGRDLLYGGQVYTEQNRPIAPAEKFPWARVIVLIPETMLPASMPMPSREECVALQVVVEVAEAPEGRGGWDYGVALDAIHRRVFGAIQGQCLEAAGTEVVLPLYWAGWVNSRPVRNDSAGAWAQSAEYRTVLRGAVAA